MKTEIKAILEAVQNGGMSVDDALLAIKQQPFEDIGYAKIDTHRAIRQGAAEVIYGAGKTAEQILGIVERMMQQAELDAKAKVSETEVLTAARDRSREIIKRAEDRSREMYRVANEYTEDALRRTEEAIQMALAEVQQSRSDFRAASVAQMQKKREELAQSAEKQA